MSSQKLVNKVKIMTISIKSFALVTLTALSLTSSVMISDASADTKPSRMKYRRPVQSEQTFKPSLELKAKISPIGNWQGSLKSKYGDVPVRIEFDFSSNTTPGNWRLLGADYNAQTNEWKDVILGQGHLTPIIQGNKITLYTSGWSWGKSRRIFEGEIQNNGSRIFVIDLEEGNYTIVVDRQ